MSAMPAESSASRNLILPVLPLRDVCLFPESSLSLVVSRPGVVRAVEMAARVGGPVFALAQKDPTLQGAGPLDMHVVGTLARVREDRALSDGSRRLELDGDRRARVVTILGIDTLLVEAQPIGEGDAGEEWGPAVEALARYLHAHPDLRSFLDEQRRSAEPMSWVNLACQHLPITATARQRLLECDAPERCLKISRGLDALLRKEQGA
jgi:ATP-dependent Lon protease